MSHQNRNNGDFIVTNSTMKQNKLSPALDGQLKKRIKTATKSGKLDVTTTPNCQFNFKYVPSLIYKTFGQPPVTANSNSVTKSNSTTTSTATSSQVVDLRELWLSKNMISVLTRELYSLPKLQVLCLSDNHLTAVPSAIGDISTLKRLILNGNKITSIPADIMRCTQLEELRLDNNRLSEFPLCVTELKKLTRLGLSKNKIGPTVPTQIRKLRRLIELDLDYNALTTLPSTFSFLSTSLQHLGLSYNRFETIPKCVTELSKLDVLRIEGNRVHTALNEETKKEETHYTIPMRHDGYPELCTGETINNENGEPTEHIIHNLPGYLEESKVYNRMNANWLRNEMRTSGSDGSDGGIVNEVNLLINRAKRKPQIIKNPKKIVVEQIEIGSVSEKDLNEAKNIMKLRIKSFKDGNSKESKKK